MSQLGVNEWWYGLRATGDKYELVKKSSEVNPPQPVYLGYLLDAIGEERGALVGKIDFEYYDKDYYENSGSNPSEKSGLFNYEEFSKTYAKEHATERVGKLAKKTDRILEIGCAYGWTVDELRKIGYDAYGCDISEYATHKMSRDYIKCIHYVRDYWDDGSFDLIYSFNTFEHIATEDVRTFLHNIRLSLRSGGILLATIDDLWGADLSHQCIKPFEWWVKIMAEEHLVLQEKETEMFRSINGGVWGAE